MIFIHSFEDCSSWFEKFSDWYAKSSNLILKAKISNSVLEFEILLNASTMNLSFAPIVKSGPLKLGIDIPKEALPSLFVEADFAVVVSKQPVPLQFALRLDISPDQAKGTAIMSSEWVNPLNISDQLSIGQVALEVGILYANVIYPNELGFGGHLKIGEVGGKVAIEITDDPAEGLLIVELYDNSKLDIINLVKFARTVTKNDTIPEPTSDFLIFEDFKLDVSTGVMFAGSFYDAGVTFKSAIELFGKRFAVDCEINTALPAIIAKGSMDAFELGPLTVKAAKQAISQSGPEIDIEFGTSRKHISFDGEVEICGIAEVSISFLAELHPTSNLVSMPI